MLIVANLLLLPSTVLLVGLALARPRRNPEGPVGMHMVTGPLALAQAAAVGLALAAGAAPALGRAAGAAWLVVPGLLVGLTILPILALEPRKGAAARAGVLGGAAGAVLLVDGAALAAGAPVLQWGGLGLVGVVAAAGYSVLVAGLVQGARNRVAVARADAQRLGDFERSQAEWQRGEWATVPPDAPLWRLVQFTHAFDDTVKHAARARVAAYERIDEAMAHLLLETGWQDEGMRCIRDCYPGSRAALALALCAHLARERERWRERLDGEAAPGSWWGNLVGYVETAAAVQRDGGEVGAEMARWSSMLGGRRGLEGLARRAGELAR